MDILSWLIPTAFAVGAILAAARSQKNNPGKPPINQGPGAWEKYYEKQKSQNDFFLLALFMAIMAIVTALAIWRWPDWWIMILNGRYLPFD